MKTIGIDVGGTNIVCGLVNEEGKILFKSSCKTGASRPAEEILADMARLVDEVLEQTGTRREHVLFCGIACPGIANIERGVIEYSCNLPTFLDLPIVKDFHARTGIRTIAIDNDANCAAKGEAEAGAAKNVADSVLITLGTGVGGGYVKEGKIFHGFNFAGGEMGHIVIDQNGPVCSCGRRGCWETFSSATALVRQTRAAMEKDPASVMWTLCGGDLDAVDGRTAFDGLRKGDPTAKAVVDQFCRYLACGVTNIVNILQPEILSVGGGISAEGETLLAPVREILEKEQYSRSCARRTVLKKAELGNDAGVIGAALLWR
ncbi:MAG: ROK family protein [Clostridia bacterium]|nr:ROK family protein [Clostridia bacterium]